MYSIATRVAPSQAGRDGRQTLVSIVSMMQDCSQLWLDSEPALARHLVEDEDAMLLATRQVEVCRRAEMGEHLTVTTSVYACNKRLGYRNTFIYDSQGAPVAKCHCVGVFVDRATNKPGALTPEIVASLTYDPELPVACSKKKIHVPKEEGRALASFKARPSDIDFNQHVNNAQYVRMALDACPALSDSSRLRIEYRLPAREGDEIFPVVWDEPDRTVMELRDAAGKPYVVLEFSDGADE